MPIHLTHGGRAALSGVLALAAVVPAVALAQAPPATPNSTLPPLDVTTAAKPVAPKKAAVAAPAVPKQAPVPVSGPGPVPVGLAIAPGLPAQPAAQPVSTIERGRAENTRAFSVGDLLQEVPGVSIKQGNGPRDMGVSIRGSNARNGFGVRNIQVFEDGFPVTQPDGLSRTDLTDPHVYGGVDVWRGPSSALFGNYATGGAINFRTRPGGAVDGFEYGVDVGSFGYVNNHLALGEKKGAFEYALFASDVRAAGHLDNNAFTTQTVNLLASFTPSSSDRFTFKFVHNALDAALSVRLSLNQFYQNPYQSGCAATFANAAPGCGSIRVFNNGFNGAQSSLTSSQAGLGRTDTRTIVGTRWEHKVDADTQWQVQLVVDDRNINQPTGATGAVGDFLSTNLSGNLARRYSFFGLPARHLLGAYYNTLPNDSDTYNMMPGGNATLGRLTQNVNGGTTNAGLRVREEISPSAHWMLVLGSAVEQSHVFGVSTGYGYAGSVSGTPTSLTAIAADREFTNRAYEAGLLYRPDARWQFRGRVATGYGTPQIGNLFITPAGVAGNNTELQSQTNLGYDLGVDWTPARTFKLSVTGFYEFFENELVSQSPGAGLQNFTFNAPRSEHRGVEVAADWRPLPGWRVTTAYLYNDQVYTEYTERLSAGAVSNAFNRVGNKIPGNSPNELLARLGYDQPGGILKGLGAYVEYQWKDAFFMDNGNLLAAPGYELVNLNVHYNPELGPKGTRSVSLFFEVRNVFDKTYAASANNISNSLNAGTAQENGASVLANSTGSIYAGMPRTFYGGLKVRF